jgi:RNA polymerase sigma-70 factor (ECF subfamily)
VRLSELEGVSQAEVAARLGLSASGARSRVQRGRRMVREALDDCCRVVIDGGEVVDVTARAGCGCVEVGVEPGQRADGACDGAPCGAASG